MEYFTNLFIFFPIKNFTKKILKPFFTEKFSPETEYHGSFSESTQYFEIIEKNHFFVIVGTLIQSIERKF